MSDKLRVPMRFEVSVEEQFHQPANKRWRAQFRWYPLGYFRGDAHCPAAALAVAWRNFRREVDPGKRWWAAAFGSALDLSSPDLAREWPKRAERAGEGKSGFAI